MQSNVTNNAGLNQWAQDIVDYSVITGDVITINVDAGGSSAAWGGAANVSAARAATILAAINTAISNLSPRGGAPGVANINVVDGGGGAASGTGAPAIGVMIVNNAVPAVPPGAGG